jgi:hypothetical protein
MRVLSPADFEAAFTATFSALWGLAEIRWRKGTRPGGERGPEMIVRTTRNGAGIADYGTIIPAGETTAQRAREVAAQFVRVIDREIDSAEGAARLVGMPPRAPRRVRGINVRAWPIVEPLEDGAVSVFARYGLAF